MPAGHAAPDGTLFFTGLSVSQAGSWVVQVSPDELIGEDGKVQAQSTIRVDSLVQGIVATDTHVSAVLGEGGLVLFGRNDGQLAEVGSLATGFDQALGLAVYPPDQLVVANGQSGLVVVDVSDPTQPTITSEFADNLGTARRVQVTGNTAYVAEISSGVSVVDLAKGELIGQWSTYDGASAMDLVLAGPLVYVANWEDLVILDATDPTDPIFVGSEMVEALDGGIPHVVAVDGLDGVVYAGDWSGVFALAFGGARPAPDIRLSRRKLDFGWVTLKQKGQGFIVHNIGDRPLQIDSLEVSSSVFTAEMDAEDPIAPRGRAASSLTGEGKGARAHCRTRPGLIRSRSGIPVPK